MRNNVLNLPNLSIEKQRGRNYTKKSRKHPAKMNTTIAEWAIQKYTREGDWVLDPMSGIGTVPVEAGWLGRCAVGIEYEHEWYDELTKNLCRVMQTPTVHMNSYLGDCRYLIPLTDEGPYDLIMFSPPYGNVISSRVKDEGGHAVKLLQKIRKEEGMWPVPREVLRKYAKQWRQDVHEGKEEGKYSLDPDNIGNMRPDDYREAMLDIYKACLNVIEPGGHMALVTRNNCKEWKQVRFDMETIDLCQQAGWIFKERWYAPIYRYSFWTNNYKKRCEAKGLHDVVPKYDDILVFEVP